MATPKAGMIIRNKTTQQLCAITFEDKGKVDLYFNRKFKMTNVPLEVIIAEYEPVEDLKNALKAITYLEGVD